MSLLRCALVVALSFSALPARADVPPPEVMDDPALAEATVDAGETPNDGRPPRVKSLSLGMGYHATLFRTQIGDRYALHGPSIVFNQFVGRRWGFAYRAEAYFPLIGRMSGDLDEFRGSLRNMYADRRVGFDLTFMAAYRQVVSEHVVMIYAGGIHVQTGTIRGAEVSPIELITGGLGGLGRLEWHPHHVMFLAAELALGIDFIDFIDHQNRATLTTPLSGALMLGVRH